MPLLIQSPIQNTAQSLSGDNQNLRSFIALDKRGRLDTSRSGPSQWSYLERSGLVAFVIQRDAREFFLGRAAFGRNRAGMDEDAADGRGKVDAAVSRGNGM